MLMSPITKFEIKITKYFEVIFESRIRYGAWGLHWWADLKHHVPRKNVGQTEL